MPALHTLETRATPVMTASITQHASVPLVIGVTGHRDLLPDELPVLESAVGALFDEITRRFPGLPITVMTPLAEGADRLAAQVAWRAGHHVSVLLPMPKDVYQADFDAASNSVFEEMLGYGEVIELPLLAGQDTESVHRPGPARDAQYEYLGIYLAAHCHILLALWDGRETGGPGGTADVIRFHQEDVVRLVSFGERRSPIDFSEDESDLVHHIACSRIESGAPAGGMAPGERCWLTRDDLTPRTHELPPRYAAVFARMAEFNADAARLDTRDAAAPLAPYPSGPSARHLDDIHALHMTADALALRYQKTAMLALRGMFTFIGLTGMSFILYADFSGMEFMIYSYLVFMSLVIGLYALERRGQWYRKFVDYRGLAEGLRVQFYWSLAGVPQPNAARFAHDSFMKRQDLETGWIRNLMRYAGRRADAVVQAPPAALEDTVRCWVGGADHGQLGYYRHAAQRLHRRSRRTLRIANCAFAGGLLVAVGLALSQDTAGELVQNTMIALMGALPFLAAVRQTYAYRVAERELVAQFTHMVRIYSNAHRLLECSSGPDERREILRALGEAAIDESNLWVLRQRERPLSSGHLLAG
jgi:hypothetical protein